MAKLELSVKVNKQYLMQVFDEGIAASSAFNKIQLRAYKRLYMGRVMAMFKMFKRKCATYIVSEGEDWYIAHDEGDWEYIIQQEKRFLKFLNSDHTKLKNEQEYKTIKSDSRFNKLMRNCRKHASQFNDKLVRKALGGNTIEDFFISIGIVVVIHTSP